METTYKLALTMSVTAAGEMSSASCKNKQPTKKEKHTDAQTARAQIAKNSNCSAHYRTS
jgi:hypothetical protein